MADQASEGVCAVSRADQVDPGSISTAPVLKPFRAFCSNQYYSNRDEYFAYGQQQPYTCEEYVREHMQLLKQQYRAARQERTGRGE